MNPTEQQAGEFALMLLAGLPARDAIDYFVSVEDPMELAGVLKAWMKSSTVRAAIRRLEGKPWQHLSVEERMQSALNTHYSQLATLLRTSNYIEAGPGEKTKMDSARQALEAKIAGQAGRGDALSQFFSDITAGRVKLPVAIKRAEVMQ